MKVVAKNLPVEEIDNYTQMFHMMDKDKNGSLTLEELKEGLQINGHPVPETEIKMLLEAVSALLCISIASSFIILIWFSTIGILETELQRIKWKQYKYSEKYYETGINDIIIATKYSMF